MTRLEHLLTIVSEECAEVAQRASKAVRFGLHEVQPVSTGGDGVTDNFDRLRYEFGQLLGIMRLVGISPNDSFVQAEALAKVDKVERFLLYSAAVGTLSRQDDRS